MQCDCCGGMAEWDETGVSQQPVASECGLWWVRFRGKVRGVGVQVQGDCRERPGEVTQASQAVLAGYSQVTFLWTNGPPKDSGALGSASGVSAGDKQEQTKLKKHKAQQIPEWSWKRLIEASAQRDDRGMNAFF